MRTDLPDLLDARDMLERALSIADNAGEHLVSVHIAGALNSLKQAMVAARSRQVEAAPAR